MKNCNAIAGSFTKKLCLFFCLAILAFRPLNAQSDTTLKGFSPFPFGAAMGAGRFTNTDPSARNLHARECNSITSETSMKFMPLHPFENTYTWGNADSVVNFATRNGQRVHGHTLIWHNSNPDWVVNFVGDSAAWENMMKTHIQTVVTKYKGRIASWDVVNEVIDSSGALRNNIWLQHLGSGYIARAFRYAHEADSSALLFYNEYGHEVLLKLNAIKALCISLKNSGVPIHGAGLQMHMSKNISNTTIDRAIDTMMGTGLLIHISELDVAMNREGDDLLTYTPLIADMLAQKYKFILRTVRRIPSAQMYGVTTWGITDKFTYMKAKYNRDDWPLPFDTLFQKKLAFQGIKDGVTKNWNFKASGGQSIAGTYTDLGSNGTAITTNFAGNAMTYDEDNSSVQDIGFNFNFNGTDYSTFVLNTNGIIKFGRMSLPDSVFYSSPTGVSGTGAVTASYIDMLYPYNHDLKGTDSSSYRVYTSGTAGSKVCTIQFRNIADKSGAVQQYSNMSFQVKLYEATGAIEFVYGKFTATANAATSITAAVGIKGVNPKESVNILKSSNTSWSAALSNANNYYFVDSNYLSSGSFRFNSRNSTLPDIGRTFRFLPDSAQALRYSFVKLEGDALTDKVLLEWQTDCAGNDCVFEIERYDYNKGYTTVGTVKSGKKPYSKAFTFADKKVDDRPYILYRVRKVNGDGTAEYSSVLKINNRLQAGIVMQAVSPFAGAATVTIQKNYAAKVTLILADMNGQVLERKQMQTGAGTTVTNLNNASLAAGVYQLTAITEKGKKTIKIVKL